MTVTYTHSKTDPVKRSKMTKTRLELFIEGSTILFVIIIIIISSHVLCRHAVQLPSPMFRNETARLQMLKLVTGSSVRPGEPEQTCKASGELLS